MSENVVEGPWGKKKGDQSPEPDSIVEAPDDASFRTQRALMWVHLARLRVRQNRSSAKIYDDRELRREEREKEGSAMLRGRIAISQPMNWDAHPSYYEMIDQILDERTRSEAEKITSVRERRKELFKIDADRIVKAILPYIGNPKYPQFSRDAFDEAKRSVLEVDDNSANFAARLEKIMNDFRLDDVYTSKHLRVLAAAMLYRNLHLQTIIK